jgi:hypothetical protein
MHLWKHVQQQWQLALQPAAKPHHDHVRLRQFWTPHMQLVDGVQSNSKHLLV